MVVLLLLLLLLLLLYTPLLLNVASAAAGIAASGVDAVWLLLRLRAGPAWPGFPIHQPRSL